MTARTLALDPAARRRSFHRLVATQFLTVYNDSAFKQIVLLLALAASAPGQDLQAWAGALFASPFLLFAVFAGDLADRYSKRDVVIASKWAEVGVMLLAGLALSLGSLPFSLITLFLMGAQSAFLGPAKYGAVPELVAGPRLPAANGLFQATVLAGILVGTGSAGFLKSALGEQLWLAALLFAAIAAAGAGVAHAMAPLPAADPARVLRLNPWLRLQEGWRLARGLPGLPLALLCHAFYWLIGATALFAWNELGQNLLFPGSQWQEKQGLWSAGLAGLTVSSACGCLVAGRLCRGRLRLGLVPLGAGLMALGFLAVGLGPLQPWFVFLALSASNFFSGFYLIPVKTLVQSLPPATDLGRILGTSQMLDWLCITGASGLKILLSAAGLDAAQVFLVLGLLTGAATALLLRRRLTESPRPV